MSEGVCPIWQTPASIELVEEGAGGRPSTYKVRCYRAGGVYRVTDTAIAILKSRTDEDRLRLTEFVMRNQLAGIEPQIDEYNIDTIIVESPWVGERGERLLRYLERRTKHKIGSVIQLTGQQYDLVRAVTASEGLKDTNFLIRMLESEGLIHVFNPIHGHLPDVRLEAKGFQRLHEMRQGAVVSTQAFVAMWFSPEMEQPFRTGFEPAIRDAGYDPVRIDKKDHNNKIDDEIVAEIRRSKFLVADFTSEPEKPRGGVYFEAGFAKGLGKEVVWTCREDCLQYVHFDTRQYNHIVWSNPNELRSALARRISASVGDGPLKVLQ